jgi:hypothetical protein
MKNSDGLFHELCLFQTGLIIMIEKWMLEYDLSILIVEEGNNKK